MSTPPEPPVAAPRPSRLRRAWPVLKPVIGLAVLGVAIWALKGKVSELTGVTGYLDHLRWWWMVIAVGAEFVSYGALSSLQRRLLRAGSVRVPAATMMGITLAGSAIQYTFPAGSVLYLAYLWRQFKRWGADDLLAGWVVVAFNLVTFVALAVLAAIGLALAFGYGSTLDLVYVITGILVLALAFLVVVRERRRLMPHLARTVHLSQRFFHWPRPDQPAGEVVSTWAAELTAVSPSRRVWTRAFVMGMANWLADLSCLVMSFYAVRAGVPWRALLLAYGAGQLATALPITPGGLGVAEGSLTIALLTFGGDTAQTAAAVLLYRMVSFWLMLPVGWLAVGRLSLTARRIGLRSGSAQIAPVESGA